MKKIPRRRLTPKALFHGLAHELELLAPVYARLRIEHTALSPYPTLATLMTRLTAGPRDDAKNELLAALIAIRQASPHRLWVAILLRAFRPMLAKLWKELFGSDCQERLALLLIGFQGAVLHVDPIRDPIRIAMYIRQATRRRAIVSLSKEVQWNDIGFGEEADEVADPKAEDVTPRTETPRLETFLRWSALSAQIKRTHPALSRKEQYRVYRKIRKRIRRALLETPIAPPKEVAP